MKSDLRWLLDKVADYTGVPYSDIDPERPFMELGFDSQSVVRFIGEVEMELGLKLDTTALINYPTIKKLYGYLKGTLKEKEQKTSLRLASDRHKPIAITGMACRFPDASTPDEFFENLRRKKVSVVPFPEDRMEMCRAGSNVREEKFFNGGYLSGIDKFDNSYFNISADEAALTDPQQRLLMQEIVHALEDAGISSEDIAKNKIGMFVGASNNDYHRYILRDERNISTVIGNSMAMISNRMSYFFDLKGPSLTIDTACSSSLVAVAQAVDSLENGSCDIAIAAGVNIIADPEINRALYEAGMLSPDGLCHTFDERANGYVRGEGVGVVVLRRLDTAERSGSRIYARILGKAINQDGRSASITAPNKNMQISLITSACDITLLFSGQGTQWIGMGKGLEIFPAYREKFAECAKKFKEIGHCDLDALMMTEDKEIIADSYNAQPMIFSIQVSIAALLKSIGINFNTVCGHSLGEVAAAYVSGAISLASAIKIIHHRSTILRRFTGKGKMLSVSLSEEEVYKYIEGYSGLSVGVVNADDSVVISGNTAEAEEVKQKLEANGIKCRYLPVNYAFHYIGIEPFKQELIDKLGTIRTKPSDIRFISTVTGEEYDHRALGAEYWADNMRCTVRFNKAAKVFAPKSDIVIEIAPSSALLYYLEGFKEHGMAALSVQKRHIAPVKAFLDVVSELFTLGCDIEWGALGISGGRYVRLPSYRFKENSCWYYKDGSVRADEVEEAPETKTYTKEEINDILLDIVSGVSCISGKPESTTEIAALELDSLKMFQMNAKINSIFGISLRYSDLDKCITIADVADKINSSAAAERVTSYEDTDIGGLITDGQMSMIRDQFISYESNKYVLCGAWKMSRGTDPDKWEEACNKVIGRYGVLGLVFERRGRDIIQRSADKSFSTERTFIPDGMKPEEFFDEKLNRPFDLEKETIRSMIAVSGEDWYFGLSVHHCVIDGISLLILIKEIAEGYAALMNGEKLNEKRK